MAVLMAMVILLVPDEQAANPQAIVAQPLPPPAGPEAVTDGKQGIQEAEDQRRLDQARQAREQQKAQQQAQREAQRRALELQADFQRQQAQANAGVAGAAMGQQELTPEQQLQQSIRLEKIQRRHSSLRAAPVALSFRSSAAASPPVPQLEETPPPVAPQPATVAEPPVPAPAAQEPEPVPPAEQALVESGVVAAVRQPQAAG